MADASQLYLATTEKDQGKQNSVIRQLIEAAAAEAATTLASRKFSINDYGADTNSADNSAAIQAAITAAVVDGGTVTCVPGRYQMGHGVSVPTTSTMVILDFGGSIFFMQDDTTGTLFTFGNQYGQFKNCEVAHFGTGGIDECIAIDGAHAFYCENLNLSGEFGSVTNCCRLTDTSDDVFVNCTFQFATGNGVLCDGTAQFLVFIKGSFFACDVGFRSDTAQLQNPFFLEVVSAECVNADYQINGAISPTWLNCDIEGTAGSSAVGTAFNFYSTPIIGATVENCFFAHRGETIQNMVSSRIINNSLYNESIVFDSTNRDLECYNNFAATGASTTTGITANAASALTIAQLPAIADVSPGTRKLVSNSNSATFNAVAAASTTTSTANIVPVFSDGTNWRVG